MCAKLSAGTYTSNPKSKRLIYYFIGESKALPSKERNKKEIRRDSKTGFEKFEDYFDSDSDNTTLISPDATSVDCKQSSNGIKI